jgi:hypothetical protein
MFRNSLACSLVVTAARFSDVRQMTALAFIGACCVSGLWLLLFWFPVGAPRPRSIVPVVGGGRRRYRLGAYPVNAAGPAACCACCGYWRETQNGLPLRKLSRSM